MATHTYSLVISYNCSNQFCQNVLHYEFDDIGFATTAAAALQLCTDWDTNNTAALRSILSTGTKLLSLKARALNISGGFEGFKPYAPGTAGVIAGNQQCAGVGALVLLLPIGNAKQKGKVFIPGVPDSDCLNGDLTAGYLGTFASAATAFEAPFSLTAGGSPTATPVVYSKGPPPISRHVQYAKMQPMIATLKRRLRPV